MSASRFVFIVEGKTEKESLRAFLANCLSWRGVAGVGIKILGKDSASKVFHEGPKLAGELLNAKDGESILAVYTLLDIFNAGIFPETGMSIEDRVAWGRDSMQQRFLHPRYRHYFAVHELEAWLLADTANLPAKMRADLRQHQAHPEQVNDKTSPSNLISASHLRQFNRKYSKPVHGRPLSGIAGRHDCRSYSSP